MATRHTEVTKGARSLDDRGSRSNFGGGRLTDKAPVAVSNTQPHEIALQSKKTGYIAQLTADGDRYNELTGVRIKGRPLVLNFTAHGGYLKLNLQNHDDRRRWLYIVGSEQAEQDFAALKIKHTPDPKDGTDPIAPHPRYGMGKSFWKLSEMQEEATKAKRRALLDQLAQDSDLQEFVMKNPKDLAAHLAERREELATGKRKKKPAPITAAARTADDEGGGDGSI